MRGVHKRLFILAAAVLAMAAAIAPGCRSGTRSGLPDHINTVEVHIFQNKTMYYGVEGWLTREIIDRINGDPNIKLVSRNGDALLTGEILEVHRDTLRETTTNEPGTVRITISAEFSFYDNVERRFIVEDARITSTETGSYVSIYEYSRGDTSEGAEREAAKQLASEIVRRTVGMW